MSHWLKQNYKRLGLALKSQKVSKSIAKKDKSSDAIWKFEEKSIVQHRWASCFQSLGALYTRKNCGPSNEPWGTSVCSSSGGEVKSPIRTVCFLHEGTKRNHFSAVPEMPRPRESLCSRIVWSIASNADDRPNNTRITTCWLSRAQRMSFCIRAMAVFYTVIGFVSWL